MKPDAGPVIPAKAGIQKGLNLPVATLDDPTIGTCRIFHH